MLLEIWLYRCNLVGVTLLVLRTRDLMLVDGSQQVNLLERDMYKYIENEKVTTYSYNNPLAHRDTRKLLLVYY